jgi:hypothetical protein
MLAFRATYDRFKILAPSGCFFGPILNKETDSANLVIPVRMVILLIPAEPGQAGVKCHKGTKAQSPPQAD